MTLFSRRQVLHAGVQIAGASTLASLMPSAVAATVKITTTPLADGLWLLQGAGCNVLGMRGKDSALLVDGGLAAYSKSLLQAAAKATGNSRVAKLINTHWHPEQTGSNEAVGRTGGEIISHENSRLSLGRTSLSTCYEGSYGPLSVKARPTKTTRTKETFEFNGQSIEYGYLPAAHTDGDLYVYLPSSNVLVGGGPVASEQWPILDIRNGGWTGGLVRAHEALAAIVKPDTKVIPATGKLMTGADIIRHRDMYQELFKQLFVYLNKGFGPSDVVTERPLKAHEAELGDPAQFLIGAYRSILMAYVPD